MLSRTMPQSKVPIYQCIKQLRSNILEPWSCTWSPWEMSPLSVLSSTLRKLHPVYNNKYEEILVRKKPIWRKIYYYGEKPSAPNAEYPKILILNFHPSHFPLTESGWRGTQVWRQTSTLRHTDTERQYYTNAHPFSQIVPVILTSANPDTNKSTSPVEPVEQNGLSTAVWAEINVYRTWVSRLYVF